MPLLKILAAHSQEHLHFQDRSMSEDSEVTESHNGDDMGSGPQLSVRRLRRRRGHRQGHFYFWNRPKRPCIQSKFRSSGAMTFSIHCFPTIYSLFMWYECIIPYGLRDWRLKHSFCTNPMDYLCKYLPFFHFHMYQGLLS